MTDECIHCWHADNFTHAIYVKDGIHIDEYCCKCGEKRCRNEYLTLPVDKTKHGPFLK